MQLNYWKCFGEVLMAFRIFKCEGIVCERCSNRKRHKINLTFQTDKIDSLVKQCDSFYSKLHHQHMFFIQTHETQQRERKIKRSHKPPIQKIFFDQIAQNNRFLV